MNRRFDAAGQIEPYSFILSYPDHRHLGELVNITDRHVNEIFNGADEISFTIHRYADGVEEELWDDLIDLQYIFVPQMQEYFLIEVSIDDKDETIKTVSGVGAAEAELSQSLIYSLEINTDIDIEREEYVLPTKFYDRENPENSFLNRTLDKLPNWSVGDVDGSLQNVQRTFSVSNSTVYDFLTGEAAEQFGCMFTFDSVNRTINAHDLKTVCKDCGYRGKYDTKCPKCGGTNLWNYGKDTTIYIDDENLAQSLTLSTPIDQIKNCFRMEAGDDEMTAAVINQNPTGSAYVYYFSPENKALMPENLVHKLEDYDKLVQSYAQEAQTLSRDIYQAYDKIMELTSTMMPGEKWPPTTAEEECSRLLESDTLSPLGFSRLSASTSLASIENALSMWIRAHCHTAGYKVELLDQTWQFYGKQPDGSTSGIWVGKIRLTNFVDKDDTYTTVPIPIKVWDDYGTYMVQRLEKLLENYNKKEKGNIYDPIKIEDIGDFRLACEKYCLNRLKSFADAIEGCIVLMTQDGVGYENPTNEKAELKEKVYDVFVKKLEIVNEVIGIRQGQIDAENEKLEKYLDRHREIQKILDFEKFLGEELYKVFLVYKREDVYSNSNYISTDLDNVTIWENAGDFVNAAKEALYESATYQHQISGEIINFLAMPEFEALSENFELGNWIRVKLADEVYRLRLVKIGFDFENPENSEIEFSDVTKVIGGASDLYSILSQAKSMAGSYNCVKTQVRKSKEQTDILKGFVDSGLDTTTMNIIGSSENADIVQNENGMLFRRYDDITNTYDPEQIRIINNGIYYTKDNWKSSKSALGKFEFTDPDSGQTIEGFGIIADQIVSNVVLTKDVGVYNENNTIQLNGNGFTFVADCTNGANQNIFDISKQYKDDKGEVQTKKILTLDSDGNLVFDGTSMKIILEGDAEIKTFQEALSGSSLADKINSSGASINIDSNSIRLTQSALSWKNDNSSMDSNGDITAKNVDLDGSFFTEAVGTEESPNKYFIGLNDGILSGGMNTEQYGEIRFAKYEDTNCLDLICDGINLASTKLLVNGTSLPTKTITVVTGVVQNDDGTLTVNTDTIDVTNGLVS